MFVFKSGSLPNVAVSYKTTKQNIALEVLMEVPRYAKD